MEYILLTEENLEKEHICCAISSNKDIQVSSKKTWLAGRFEEGLVFLRSKERGKCFIEYIPAENAWVPIDAPGYMYIDCLWVSGSLAGHGYAKDLLERCISDSRDKGRKGLCILGPEKKKLAFLADPRFLRYMGFTPCDRSENGISLWYLPFDEKETAPAFCACARHPCVPDSGFVLYYTNQCPFTARYVPVIEGLAKEHGLSFKTIHLISKEEAKRAPTPVTTYALFLDGRYLSNEILSEKKFLKLIGIY